MSRYSTYALCPMPHAPCPMPHAPCPEKRHGFVHFERLYEILIVLKKL
jgi:hypothetical protein